jgi:HTH-type transcriptional regulator/antitoxin MqsA
MERALKENDKCPICDKGYLQLISKEIIYYYRGKRIILPNQEVFKCSFCNEELLNDELARRQDKNLKFEQRKVDGLLSAEEIKKIRQKFRMSQETFARVLNIGKKSLAKYETYAVNQSVAMDLILRLIDKFGDSALEEIMKARFNQTGAVMLKDSGKRRRIAKVRT